MQNIFAPAAFINDEGRTALEFVAFEFNRLLHRLENIAPTGRELALVKTKLQEAKFWACEAIAKDPRYQVPNAALERAQ